jgi:diphthamide synthase subunit DPH2
MAVAFSSNDETSNFDTIETFPQTRIEDIYSCFEIERCIDWIQLAEHKTVALQFPDSLMKYSPHVASSIESKMNQK